jgi:hypothetical protein
MMEVQNDIRAKGKQNEAGPFKTDVAKRKARKDNQKYKKGV